MLSVGSLTVRRLVLAGIHIARGRRVMDGLRVRADSAKLNEGENLAMAVTVLWGRGGEGGQRGWFSFLSYST